MSEERGKSMAMTLVFGTLQGLAQAERFSEEHFGTSGGLRVARRAKIKDSARGTSGRLYPRYLAGELEPKVFDGHAVAIDYRSEYDGEDVDLDLARDGLVDSFGVGEYLGYYALGARVAVRWLQEPGNLERHYIEVWADLNEHEFPMVTNPSPRQERHVQLPNWRPGT